MVRKALSFMAIALLGTGCLPGNNGIWLIFIPPMDDLDCDLTAQSNFVGASVPEETIDETWTETETYQASDGTGFAQIFDVGGGEEKKIMVFEGLTYLGTREEGVWRFTWTNSEETRLQQIHESGYSFSLSENAELVTTIEMDFSGNTAAGTIRLGVDLTNVWTESDTWDADATGIWGGELPAYWFLEDTDGNSVYNDEDTADCSGTLCELTVTQDCTQSADFEARQTHYDEDAYYGIQDAGNEPGVDN